MKHIEYWILTITGILTLVLIYMLIVFESSPFREAAPERYHATVQYASGPFEILPYYSTSWMEGNKGVKLKEGDRIRTGNETIRLDFNGASLLVMGSNSDLKLNINDNKYAWSIQINKGNISYRFSKLLPNIPSVLNTPHGSARYLPLPEPVNREIFITVDNDFSNAVAHEGSPDWLHKPCMRFWGRTTCNRFWSGKSISQSVPENSIVIAENEFISPIIKILTDRPVIQNPDSGFEYAPGYMLRGFNIVWQPVLNAVSYTLEINKLNPDSESTRWINTENTAYRIQNYDEGNYNIRVFATLGDGSRTAWSDPTIFNIGGRLFADVSRPTRAEPVRFRTKSYLEGYMIGGYVRRELAASHDIIFYVLTDQWWIQPLEKAYRIPIKPDGYFESFTNYGREIYLLVVKKDNTSYPVTAAHTRDMPFADGSRIIFNMLTPMRR